MAQIIGVQRLCLDSLIVKDSLVVPGNAEFRGDLFIRAPGSLILGAPFCIGELKEQAPGVGVNLVSTLGLKVNGVKVLTDQQPAVADSVATTMAPITPTGAATPAQTVAAPGVTATALAVHDVAAPGVPAGPSPTDSTTGTPAGAVVPVPPVGGSGATAPQEAAINDNFATVAAALTGIFADVAVHDTEIGDTATALDDLTTKFAAVVTDLGALNTEVGDTATDLAALKVQGDANVVDIAAVNAELVKTKADLDDVKAQLNLALVALRAHGLIA